MKNPPSAERKSLRLRESANSNNYVKLGGQNKDRLFSCLEEIDMLKPDYIFNSICDITFEFVKDNNINALILDIDNTLTVPDKKEIPKDIEIWLDNMKQNGVKLAVLSNNSHERVGAFAKTVGLPFVSKALKPKTDGYLKAAKLVGEDIKKCAFVGDQLFTDILGGNRCGAKSILTKPFAKDQTVFIGFKRILEKPFLSAYKGKGRLQE